MKGVVVIVGGGISGLACASTIGKGVLVLDKGNHAGGRMLTTQGLNGAVFDVGAQFFTVRTKVYIIDEKGTPSSTLHNNTCLVGIFFCC